MLTHRLPAWLQAPLSNVANVAGDLAVKADQLGGLDWGRMLLRVDGFRQDDCDEVASISRQLLFDLVTGLVSQARFAGEHALSTMPVAHSARVQRLLRLALSLPARP